MVRGLRGFGSGLVIAPSGRYCLIQYYDIGPGEEARCGLLRAEGMRLVASGEPHGWESALEEGPPYHVIRWGPRRYVVPERKMLSFVNDVNATEEPGYGGYGSFAAFIRPKDRDFVVSGPPDLPPEFADKLRPGLIDATALWVGARGGDLLPGLLSLARGIRGLRQRTIFLAACPYSSPSGPARRSASSAFSKSPAWAASAATEA